MEEERLQEESQKQEPQPQQEQKRDLTQIHEWARHAASLGMALLIASYAVNNLKEEKENREIKKELEGELTTKFEVVDALVRQQNREVAGIVTFNNDSLSDVKVTKIVLHVYHVSPIKALRDRLIVDADFQQLNNDYTNLSYEYAEVSANRGETKSTESVVKMQDQLVELERQLSDADTRQTQVYFVGRCAPEHTKYEKLQTIDLGESFSIGAKSSHGYSFRMIEARPLVIGSVSEWIKYDIVIDYETEGRVEKQVAASVFSGDSSAGMPGVMCYPTGM